MSSDVNHREVCLCFCGLFHVICIKSIISSHRITANEDLAHRHIDMLSSEVSVQFYRFLLNFLLNAKQFLLSQSCYLS